MRCEVRVITPEEAARLLEGNTANRALKQSHVEFFEEQLKRGEMQLTHQGIAISETGKLLDGQHRLTAIVNTGIAAQLLVAVDLPDQVFPVLDTGRARMASDVISMAGVPDAMTVASGIRSFLLYQAAPGIVWTGAFTKNLGTTTAVKAAYEKDPEGWQWASRAARSQVLAKVVIPASATCLLYLAAKDHGFDRAYLQGFLRGMKEGAGLKAGHPVLAYRNKALMAPPGRSAQGRLADYIKLLNAYATGQQLKIFKAQQFPPMPFLIHASESIHEEAQA